jgi:endonuclease/exonuclease/phosphatase (EEP) superfamily protein YafD
MAAVFRVPQRFVACLAWIVTLCLAVIAVLRIVDHDGFHLLIWLTAFTRYVYLPAYAILAWAAYRKRWWLAIFSAAIVCLHIAWIAPDFMRDRRFDVDPSTLQSDSPKLRIFFANLCGTSTEYAATLEEIRDADPDVVVLVEFGWGWHWAFYRAKFTESYPYGQGSLDENVGRVSIFSRIPLKSEKRDWIAYRAVETVEVPLGSQTLRLIGLHAPRPMNLKTYHYESYWQEVVPKLLAEPGPLVIVGDCNATQYSRVYKQITADHLRSAHEDRGRGYATSWPNWKFPFPPIRIDQAFLSPEVECLSIREGIGRGSDHRPLILDVKIRVAK